MKLDPEQPCAFVRHDESALFERLRCPHCGGALTMPANEQARCTVCSRGYVCVNGIWSFLTDEQLVAYADFMKSYPVLRAREGWERDYAYYLRLPDVPADDPAAAIWQIRRRSLRVLEGAIQKHIANEKGLWALDLGAGNGWLSRRLALSGFRTVALDLNVTGSDSLLGAQLYIDHDGIRLDRVQASMDRLPFADNTFALCTVSSALYYANVEETLASAYRVLQPGGLLAITDSPVYSSSAPGRAMASEQRSRIKNLLGQEPAVLPGGTGFLVGAELVSQMRRKGFQVRMTSTQRPLGRIKRRILGILKPAKREEALFPVFIGVKPQT